MTARYKITTPEHRILPPAKAGSSMEAVLSNLRRPKKRLKLWEIEQWMMCSIVGTCLTPPDINRVIKKHKLKFSGDIREHHLHSFFVERAAEQGPVSRSLNKLLDEKFAPTVKLVGQESDETRLEEIWQDLCAKGHVAAGYWAFMSQNHIPDRLKNDIFGDVHMLSHFMGGHNRQTTKALWMAEQQKEQLASRLAKARQHAQDTIAAKDARIAELDSDLQETRLQLTNAFSRLAQSAVPSGAKPHHQRRSDRRLSAARARIRSLEEQNERLRHLLEAVADIDPPTALGPSRINPGQVNGQAAPEPVELAGLQLLYVGGRHHLLPHLRARAEALDASLLHHDGGQEETLKSLDGLVDQADVVFCPIDCISHQACLKAKHLCKRQAKPFVPLRSSSASCFTRAIKMLETGKMPETGSKALEQSASQPKMHANA